MVLAGVAVKKKWKTIQGKDLEKRLVIAYNAGHYDGYNEGLEAAHEVWAIDVCKRTPGVGPKIQDKLIESAIALMKERQEAKFGPSDPAADLVREEIAQLT